MHGLKFILNVLLNGILYCMKRLHLNEDGSPLDFFSRSPSELTVSLKRELPIPGRARSF